MRTRNDEVMISEKFRICTVPADACCPDPQSLIGEIKAVAGLFEPLLDELRREHRAWMAQRDPDRMLARAWREISREPQIPRPHHYRTTDYEIYYQEHDCPICGRQFHWTPGARERAVLLERLRDRRRQARCGGQARHPAAPRKQQCASNAGGRWERLAPQSDTAPRVVGLPRFAPIAERVRRLRNAMTAYKTL